MLEHHSLARLHAVDAAVEDACHEDIGSVDSRIVDAGVAVLCEAQFHIGRPGAADEDSEVGSEQDVGVSAGSEAGFNCAVIKYHHQAWHIAGRYARIRSQFDGGRGADAKHASTRQSHFGGPRARCDRPV